MVIWLDEILIKMKSVCSREFLVIVFRFIVSLIKCSMCVDD